MTCCICNKPIAGKYVSIAHRGKAHRRCFDREKTPCTVRDCGLNIEGCTALPDGIQPHSRQCGRYILVFDPTATRRLRGVAVDGACR
jgi:hypothetical protein